MKQKETYDRAAVGMRLRNRRKQLGWSRRYVADKIELVEKYYADIERGTCGMSIETLLSLTELYGFTIDGLIYGERGGIDIFMQDKSLLKKLESLPPGKQNACKQMLTLFVNGAVGPAQEADTADGAKISESAAG